MDDIQKSPDDRGVAIDQVGVTGITYPLKVKGRDGVPQNTTARVSMSVSLPMDVRGTHMSRFLEILHLFERDGEGVHVESLQALTQAVRSELQAETGAVSFSFPYFVKKCAPVSGKEALHCLDCRLTCLATPDMAGSTITVKSPITTLCPCSKAISDYGAHNQRAYVTVTAAQVDPDAGIFWIEDIDELIDSCASCPVYPILKREDERFVTMRAYDNPAFVEDVARNAALKLAADPRAESYEVRVEAMESIHGHSAFAVVKSK